MAWPRLREELALYPGPDLPDGQPSWTIHDPVRNLFFRLDWLTFEILSLWALADPEAIAHEISASTTLHPDSEDVEAVTRFLSENQLLVPEGEEMSAMLAERYRKKRGSTWEWLLHHYLFFRIPLVRPDRWLSRHVHHVDVFYQPLFLKLTLAALLLGLLEVYRDWTHFSATLVDTLSWQGMVAYGVTLTAVKVIHELGHAFTAKRYGCRVPAMGVAFLVLWPVAYTDTNEVWKLSDPKQRLAVAGSGVASELVIASWATLAWGLLPEGTPRSLAFMLATTVWIATLAINTSPFMRFDGYFLLSDWLDMPNLHARSFALARWHLRETLFALGEPAPEIFSAKRTRALVVFAWATWIYRLILFLGIAALVYHFFIKAVGILCFMVEIGWFVLFPLWTEIKEWRRRWPEISTSRRARHTARWAAIVVILFVLPWPSRLTSSGLLRPAEVYPVYAPLGAQVTELPWSNGARVAQGDIMIQLASPDLQRRWQRANAKMEASRWQAAAAGIDVEQRQNLLLLQAERAGADAELASVQTDLETHAPKAPFTGRLVDIDPDMKPGTWVARNEKLAVLVDDTHWVVETYLDEDSVRRIEKGDAGRFFSDGLEGPYLPLTVRSVDGDATRVLPDGLLASPAGGSVTTREKNGQHIPERATYRVVLTADARPDALANGSWRGTVVIRGDWEAPGLRFLRSALTLIWREAGF
ncbi:HlyD family efflux transporter periplasmic adaptor subunit [Dechloromonas sp. HYN0024]|uniref:HlyD family efflux transporter periplasmic adaptor subunit n=1 Tax=Dechloromonas sp. HYN0024 TaxID=2231055 RepID=UPI000E451B8A|nr:HlyD family efflux transporter periplasmic adaptor subunit [Dechloromonas sp. HYN0024]AXS79453.1 HlyD family efflux transporter periplasmic adaptor subunit [Dechloromonas sp. HYN0024]